MNANLDQAVLVLADMAGQARDEQLRQLHEEPDTLLQALIALHTHDLPHAAARLGALIATRGVFGHFDGDYGFDWESSTAVSDVAVAVAQLKLERAIYPGVKATRKPAATE